MPELSFDHHRTPTQKPPAPAQSPPYASSPICLGANDKLGHELRQSVTDQIFALSTSVRYVALYRNGELTSHQRSDLPGASASESDRYEELFVNPTLLTLARQRGNLDCGGLRSVVVGYGNFYQLVMDLSDGHVSVCFELTSNPLQHAEAIRAICENA